MENNKYLIIVSMKKNIYFVGLDGDLDIEATKKKVEYLVRSGIYDDIKVLEFENFKLSDLGLLEPYIECVSLKWSPEKVMNGEE